MDELQRQVRRASWRMFCSGLLRNLTWSLFVALLIALAAIVIRKLFPLGSRRSHVAGGLGGWVRGGGPPGRLRLDDCSAAHRIGCRDRNRPALRT